MMFRTGFMWWAFGALGRWLQRCGARIASAADGARARSEAGFDAVGADARPVVDAREEWMHRVAHVRPQAWQGQGRWRALRDAAGRKGICAGTGSPDRKSSEQAGSIASLAPADARAHCASCTRIDPSVE